MRKKAFYILLLMLIPHFVYADELKMTCPDEIKAQSEFVCTLTGNTNTYVTGISAQISVSNSLKIISVIIDDKWQGDGKDGDIKIFIDPEIKGTFNVGTIKLKSNGENNSILIDSIIFYDEKVKSKRIESISKTIKISNKEQGNNQETNNNINSSNLVDLQVTNYDLNFYKDITEYTLKIDDEESLKINPILEDDNSTYKITGNSNLKNGSKIKIEVLSENGKNKTYIIKIEKNKVSTNVAIFFIVLIVILISINLVRILNKKKNDKRGSKNE